MTLPTYYPGKSPSAGEENARNTVIRQGQLSGGKGVAVSRTGNGSTVSLLPATERRIAATIGGALMVTSPVAYTGTAVQLPLEAPTAFLGAVTGSMTDADGLLDLDAATPEITLTHPGRYLIHYRATCSYAASVETGDNLSDAVSRLRLNIGGTLRAETSVYATHHAKLCATGLVRDIGTLAAENDIYGDPQLTGELAKVGAYNRWAGGKVTINGTFQVLVILDNSGNPKIATAAPVEPSTDSTTCAPTIGLWVDRSAVEPAPGVDPFTSWNDDPDMTCHEAQLHVIRLS